MRLTPSLFGNPSYSYLIDTTYRKMLGSHIFPSGWGDAHQLQDLINFHKIMSNREKCQTLVEAHPSVTIQKVKKYQSALVFDGEFVSPFVKHMPGFLPKASEMCRFQLCVPNSWKSDDRPIAIHMAGTGDQHFWRRRNLLAWSLIREHGIGSVIIENPFYGTRKPPEQVRSNVRFVSDIFVMGGGLMLESLALLRWLDSNGYGPFCMTGISMGGHMASLGASNYTKPMAIAPCLSWTTASSVFTRGVMTNAINWNYAKSEYSNNPIFRNVIRDQLVHYKLLSSKEYEERRKYFMQLAQAKEDETDSQAQDFDGNVKKSRILTKLSEKMKELQIKKLSKLLPSLNLFPPMSLSSSIIGFLSGKNSSVISYNLISPFLEKLKRQPNSEQPPSSQSQSQFHFEADEQLNEKGIRSFYKRDESSCSESLDFMHRLMDHFTHLSNFETPVDPSLAIFVEARNDAYVLRDGVTRIEEIWPGSTVRYLDTGHVVAYVRYHNEFRKAINDSITKHRQKYFKDGSPRPTTPAVKSAHPSLTTGQSSAGTTTTDPPRDNGPGIAKTVVNTIDEETDGSNTAFPRI